MITSSSKVGRVRRTSNGATDAKASLSLEVLTWASARLAMGRTSMNMVGVGIILFVWMETLELRLRDRISGAIAPNVSSSLSMARLVVQLAALTSVLGVAITLWRPTILLHRDRRIGIGAPNAMVLAGPRTLRMEFVPEVERTLTLAVPTTPSPRVLVPGCKTSGLGASTVKDSGSVGMQMLEDVLTLQAVCMLRMVA